MKKIVPADVKLVPDNTGRYHLLYWIVNGANGKEYYGIHSTRNIFDYYCGGGMRLRAAYRKYGRTPFSMYMLASFPTRESLLDAESVIVTAEFIAASSNYNTHIGGRVNSEEHTLSTRQKQSLAALGRPKNPTAVQKSAAAKRGTKHTRETIEAIRASCRGQRRTALTRQRLAQSKLGRARPLEAVCAMMFGKFGRVITPEELLIERQKRKNGRAIR